MPAASTHTGAAAQGQLGGDPAAERVADDHDIEQTELIEQRGVGRGEPGNAGQCLGARRAAEAGVGGRDDTRGLRAAEQVGKAGDRLGSAAGQQQEGTPRAAVVERDVDQADADDGQGMRAGTRQGVSVRNLVCS